MNMKLKIKNIAAIENAEFDFTGITVITGINGTGKSTIGKIIYSIFSGFNNVDMRFIEEQYSLARITIREFADKAYALASKLSDDPISKIEVYSVLGSMAPTFDGFINGAFGRRNIEEVPLLIQRLYYELSEFNYRDFLERIRQTIGTGYDRRVENTQYFARVVRDKEILCNRLKRRMDDFNGIDAKTYKITSIERLILKEFKNQISSFSNNEQGFIKLTENNTIFDLRLDHNRVLLDSIVPDDEYNRNVVYFDDASAVLRKTSETMRWFGDRPSTNHIDDLAYLIKNSELYGVAESIISNNKSNEIFENINKAFPEKIILANGKIVFGKNKIDIENLATGAKIFALFKLLIEKSILNEDSILILDEPDAHLHPEWQVYLADLLVSIYKQLGIKLIIASHSPDFLLALQVACKKSSIGNELSLYSLEKNDNRSISKNRTNDFNAVYAKMSNPAIQLQNDYISYDDWQK